MKFLEGWTFREYTIVGVTAALCIAMGIFIKVVLGIVISKIPAVGSIMLGMAQAILIGLSLMRLPRTGFLTVLGITMGSIYGFIFPGHPFMFGAFSLAGVAGDAAGMALGGYTGRYALCAAVLVFRLSVIVFGAVLAWWTGFSKTDIAWALILIDCAGSALGVVLGLWAAMRLSRELEKVGLLSHV